tara:strand:+ start:4480 stop:4671 length:192 start_codon:yes stop_codon:yes gene_type:complete
MTKFENDLTCALFDMYDVRNALSNVDVPIEIKNLPKDNDGTETTIGDCIDNVIYFLEGLEKSI